MNDINWRPPSLKELTPYLIPSELTHLGSEATNYIIKMLIKLGEQRKINPTTPARIIKGPFIVKFLNLS